MAEFPALPLWTDAYLGDTTHLDTTEHGAYLLLLITAWRSRDCSLPDDDRLLSRYARCGAAQWKKLRPVLEPFFTVKNGKWTQGRLIDEYQHLSRKREIAAANGRASALKRKGRHVAERVPSESGVPAEREQEGQRESNLTTPISNKPSISLSEKSSRRSNAAKHDLPDDWDPAEFGEGSQCRGIVDGWTPLEFERQLEKFKANHISKASKFADWQRAWATWILNSIEFAARNSGRSEPRGGNAGDFVDRVLEEHGSEKGGNK